MNLWPTQSRQPIWEARTLERLQFERSLALGCAIESTTASAYVSHLNSYLNFCRLHHRAVEPTEDTLSFFVVWLSHHIEPCSVDSYLSGIVNHLETHFPHVREVRKSLLVTCTLKGCKRRLSKSIQRKQPLTLDDLALVVDALGPSKAYDDMLFVTLLVTSFKTLQRLAELCWPNAKKHQSYRKVPLRHSLTLTRNSASYVLPHHKTSTLRVGCEILLLGEPDARVDPLELLRRYVAACDNLFPHHPHLWLAATGTIPTRAWFMCYLWRFFLPTVSGHSMRGGGATALAASGIAPALIQAAGRWSSDEFQKYICKHPFLLHLLIHGSQNL
ncbi:putative retroelement protein [Suillus subalutaceus]|uniref:putative retroelement protein n=1 Tax=Suillus subalutaceus TaxID=48586 RepID=UPI001B85DB71|nr:putative retroelement protein [Suillus subalutaceus]KAG1873558.1 putative retroelement protein [Suillus subalutaceus]